MTEYFKIFIGYLKRRMCVEDTYKDCISYNKNLKIYVIRIFTKKC